MIASRSHSFVFRMLTRTHDWIQRESVKIANRKGKIAEFPHAVKYSGSLRLQFPADEASAVGEDYRRDRQEDDEEQASLKYDSYELDAALKHIRAQ